MSQNTETTMISEREAVLREREAFSAGAKFRDLYCACDVWKVCGPNVEATARFPLPKVTRPRVVADPMRKGFEFRAIDGRIESRQAAGECATPWTPFNELELTANRIALWADLIKNPREEVEVDA